MMALDAFGWTLSPSEAALHPGSSFAPPIPSDSVEEKKSRRARVSPETTKRSGVRSTSKMRGVTHHCRTGRRVL
jgi:hypothetical protein